MFFEKRHEPIISTSRFLIRLAYTISFGIVFIVIALGIGMWGYHAFENMSWVDAFANASMILSGMGPLTPLYTNKGKMFAGFYALFSGLTFIFMVGVIFSPIIHRFFHKFHIQTEDDDKN